MTLLLRETLEDQRLPDVALAVAARLENAQRPTHANRRWGWWPQAACILMSLGVILSIARTDTTENPTPTQGRKLGPPITVDSLAAIQNLPPDTDNVRLKLHTPEAVHALVRLRKLRRLDASFDIEATWRPREVQRPLFFPAAAAPLGHLTSLEELDISGHAPIRGLAPLATLSRLRRLRIHYALIDPTSLAVLQKLPKLEDLVLEATLTLDAGTPLIDLRNPDYGLRSFATSGRLRSLRLTACIVDAEGIRAIASNPLRELHLYRLSRAQRIDNQHQGIGAKTLESIGTIKSLRKLWIGDSVNLELLTALKDLDHLTELSLSSADGLTGKPIGQALAHLPHLHKLSVGGSDVDHAALLGITKSRTVLDLSLGGDADCTDAVLAAISKMKQLRRLSMPYSHKTTDAGIAHLRNMKLEFFRMHDAGKVTPVGMMNLPRSVRELEVEATLCDQGVFTHLASIERLTARTVVHTAPGLIEELHKSPLRETLRHLVLAYKLDQLRSLEHLADFSALETIDLSNCRGSVPPEVVTKLRADGIKVNLREVPDNAADGAPLFIRRR